MGKLYILAYMGHQTSNLSSYKWLMAATQAGWVTNKPTYCCYKQIMQICDKFQKD